MNMHKSIILFGLLLFINTNTCFAESTSEEIIFRDINKLKVDVSEGSVTIKKHDLNSIKVILTKSDVNCKIDVEKQDKTLKIKNDKKLDGCNSNYDIYVSSVDNIEVSLGSNKLAVDDIKSDINFNMGAGKVELNNVEGNIKGEMGAGKIIYRPVKSKDTKTFNLAAGVATLDCYFPAETSVKFDATKSFMNNVNSTVKLIDDGTQNFVMSATIGVGSVINMSYSK